MALESRSRDREGEAQQFPPTSSLLSFLPSLLPSFLSSPPPLLSQSVRWHKAKERGIKSERNERERRRGMRVQRRGRQGRAEKGIEGEREREEMPTRC